MRAILAGTLAAERPTLLDDLLEDSARIYHRHCAVIQTVFHKQWLKTVGDYVGREQIEFPNEPAALVEARVRDRLSQYRQELRQAQAGLISQERQKRAERDRAIRCYVASLPAHAEAA